MRGPERAGRPFGIRGSAPDRSEAATLIAREGTIAHFFPPFRQFGKKNVY